LSNIIVDLTVEMRRVEALYKTLGAEDLVQAQRTVRFATQSLAMNSYDEMREALDDLRAIKPEQRKGR
jgi:hypothetical protein